MPERIDATRRTALRLSVLAAAGVAGCSTDSADTETDPSDGVTTDTATDEAATSTPELDLREANVTAVEFERQGGAYRFSVTLYHDDDGEDGYADWWQVERLDGERLGRRDLAHPHSTDPFTRSETIEVPDDVTCVVVRGHDQTHDYGGRAMLVNLESGETNAADQGTETQSFDESNCP